MNVELPSPFAAPDNGHDELVRQQLHAQAKRVFEMREADPEDPALKEYQSLLLEVVGDDFAAGERLLSTVLWLAFLFVSTLLMFSVYLRGGIPTSLLYELVLVPFLTGGLLWGVRSFVRNHFWIHLSRARHEDELLDLYRRRWGLWPSAETVTEVMEMKRAMLIFDFKPGREYDQQDAVRRLSDGFEHLKQAYAADRIAFLGPAFSQLVPQRLEYLSDVYAEIVRFHEGGSPEA
ncbi:MAG: hypothetical protein NXI04_13285 [Planctomycetaceae bacterium]|nr:hypothetical protein [Planctomycetaceae bacterium]